jgi:hypothetical protein
MYDFTVSWEVVTMMMEVEMQCSQYMMMYAQVFI